MSSSDRLSEESRARPHIIGRSQGSSLESAPTASGNPGVEQRLWIDMQNAVQTDDDTRGYADDELTGEQRLRALKTRKRFGTDEDLMLIKEVNWVLPYRKGRNNVMKSWQVIADRLNKLPTFKMEFVSNKSCQNRFNTLVARHRIQEEESAKASGVDEEYTELRSLMDDITSDFDEWENNKNITKETNMVEADAKECAGAVVRDSAMLRLREQRVADAKRAAEDEQKDEQKGIAVQPDTPSVSNSKETPTKVKNAILASLVPLVESQIGQAQGIQDILREDMVLRRQQHEGMLEVRKREREEEYEERRAQREQEFKFCQAQMEAESWRISLMISMLSQPKSVGTTEKELKRKRMPQTTRG